MRYRHASQRAFDYAQTDQRVRAGLVGHWLGDGAGLELRDRSGYLQTGTLVNSPQWGLGESGRRAALRFNGNDTRVTFTPTHLPSGGESRTVCAWVNTSDASLYGYVLSYGSGGWMSDFAFGMFGSFVVFTNNGQAVFGYQFAITDGRWHHIAVTYDGSLIRLYVDGMFDTSGSNAINTPLVSGAIGTYFLHAGSPDYTWDGWVDDIRVYDRALSGNELALLAAPSFLSVIQTSRRRLRSSSTPPASGHRFYFAA